MKSPMKLNMKSKLPISLVLLSIMVCFDTAYPAEKKDYSPFPNPDVGYVTDIAGVLTGAQKEELDSQLYTVEKSTGVEIVVVTINSIKDYPGTPNNSIEDFARGLFDAYGIGNMPKNDGILLLVATKDRKARIELGKGYGHNRDADADHIMQKVIIPEFKKNQYNSGIIKGVRSIIRTFSGMIIWPGWIKLVTVIAILIIIPISLSLFLNGKRGWGWIFAGFAIILILSLLRSFTNYDATRDSGGFSGGFGGGFGGGSSGGGGATGSW
jgi:uncharacterized protein